MRQINWWQKVLVVLVIPLIIGGCGGSVASVNGEDITQGEFDRRFDKMKAVYEMQGTNFNSAVSKKLVPGLKKEILKDLINEKLVLQEAQKRNIGVSTEMIEQELMAVKKDFTSEAFYQRSLESQKLTEDDLKDYLRVTLIIAELKREITTKVSVTKDEVYKEFRANPNKYRVVKISRIILDSEKQAKEVIDLLHRGSDFSYLAKKYSLEPGAQETGGVLEYINPGQLLPEEETYAFSLKLGDIPPRPIKTISGYTVLKVLDRKDQFYQVEKDIAHILLEKRKEEKYGQYLAELLKKAEIKQNVDF